MDKIERYWCVEEALAYSVADMLETGGMKLGEDEHDSSPFTYDVVDGTAVISLEGVLSKKRSCWNAGTSTIQFRRAIRTAAHDPKIDSILVMVDSPGGALSGTQAAAREIGLAKQIKPVEAYIDGECCSAAYWIAAQCNHIYANSTSIVGSIGVVMVVPDTSAAYEKAGIKMHVIGSSELKGAGSDGSPITPKMIGEWASTINALSGEFVAAIASGRGIEMKDATKWADARVHIAKDALSLGMIDAICNFDDLIGGSDMIGRKDNMAVASAESVYENKEPANIEMIEKTAALQSERNELRKEIESLKAQLEIAVEAKLDADFAQFATNIPPALQENAKKLFKYDAEAFKTVYGLIKNAVISPEDTVSGEDVRRSKQAHSAETAYGFETEFMSLAETIMKNEGVDFNAAVGLAAKQNPKLAMAYREEANRANS